MIEIVFSGYLFFADLLDSIIALVSSRMAFVTLSVFARVGRGFLIMEFSIWVVVITILRVRIYFSIIIFWAKIIFFIGIFIFRSLRVIMMSLEVSRISSKLLRFFWFSILEMMWMFSSSCVFRCLRISITLERLRIKEVVIKFTFCS